MLLHVSENVKVSFPWFPPKNLRDNYFECYYLFQNIQQKYKMIAKHIKKETSKTLKQLACFLKAVIKRSSSNVDRTLIETYVAFHNVLKNVALKVKNKCFV